MFWGGHSWTDNLDWFLFLFSIHHPVALPSSGSWHQSGLAVWQTILEGPTRCAKDRLWTPNEITELFFTFIFPAINAGCEMQWGDFIRLMKGEERSSNYFHKNNWSCLPVMKFTICTDGLEQTTWLEFSHVGVGHPYYLCILEHAPTKTSAETRSY